ncbi:sirohydrochlorin chelatase [Rhodococcus spelaei]|uniref:Sirohydrochlorin chelatase n=1 Tax=Rhodococcus spelaei TaxID=2546320 RepID=A0A541BMA9_9NOCA|nr:sirohydrochlorin chelatase [Rhodococcus spelaei]TQF73450.1 sirohydrochlorin chelatase [Rhodococcus spelaei]
MSVPLIAVAHGSRDPRSARAVAAAVAGIRASRSDLDVRLCFLDLSAPSADQAIDAVAAEGYSSAVVVPLLLGSAFHARVDLPGLLTAARARHRGLDLVQADVLGDDERLVDAVRARAEAAGAASDDPEVGVVLAAVGSSSGSANARTARIAPRLLAGTAWSGVETCYATTEPSLPQAVSRLRRAGAERIVVAPWFLAPGRLTDRLELQATEYTPDAIFADVIGAHPLLAEVALDRYHAGVELVTGTRAALTA